MSGNLSDVHHPPQRGGTLTANDASQAAICLGASFGIYAVRELIGIGNTASVYRAHDTRLLREVALKVLNTGALTGADGLARFLHEARMAAAIRHSNVVNIFDVGVHDGTPYIVMELLSGVDLDVRLNAARVIREPALIDIAMQLVSGLAAVHDAGIVHRDLKPSNVFLARGPDGSTQPKLLDFAASKQTRDNLRLTTSGRRRWTSMPLYTAPEILLDGEATFHSDQYSLGVLLYECVTGVNPFRADTVMESIELITTGRARPITEQPIRPSRRLAAIIERAMHVYPDQRFADLRELGRALASVSGRRARWPWGRSPELGVVRSAAPKHRRATFEPARAERKALNWVVGATVVACSIGAPLLAWQSVRQQPAAAPVSVTAPLAASGVVAAPAPVPCPAPCPTPASGRRQQPGVDGPALQPGVPPALAVAAPADPERVASLDAERVEANALEPALLTSAPELAAGDEAAPPAESPPAAALTEGDTAQTGLTPQVDGATLQGPDLAGVPFPGVTGAPLRPERGTNGALIFD
jgi:serine/threonine-protein kinase